MKPLIDYAFKDTTVSSADSSFTVEFSGATITTGPGTTPLGSFEKALDLGASGKAAVDLTGLSPDLARFCIRFVFQAATAAGSRQNLVESTLLPFSLFLDKGDKAGELNLVASVSPKAHGWQGADTRFKKGLKPGVWYTADLVYDKDTVGLFVDDTVVGVHAFPKGSIAKGDGKKLFIGTWVNGSSHHFGGSIAALQWYAGIPEEIAAKLDEARGVPEWFITYKWEAMRSKVNLGKRMEKIGYDWQTGGYLQPYKQGAIMYHDSLGAAFAMYGAIHTLFMSMSASKQSALGYLVSDEGKTTGAGGRKSLFSKGGIYWSPATGAVTVADRVYLDYEQMGESSALGFPLKPAKAVPGGLEQQFQGARMYHREGASNAFEVHGAILERFLATGGVTTWGFPVTNEMDVNKDKKPVGRSSDFEGCTFYWSPETWAHEVHGDIRTKYNDIGGAISDLGFPTSDEQDIPGVSGAGRMNSFQNGSVLWYGSFDSIILARPFKLFIGTINSQEEEGAGQGQNDLYFYAKITEDGTTVYDKRHPSSSYWGGQNVKTVNLKLPAVIVPNSPTKTVQLIVSVWDYDDWGGGGDDHLGKWTKTLNAANGWGLRENDGILKSGSFSHINSITASVKPHPEADPATLTEVEKWWGVANKKTATLTYQQYATAFVDVDSDPEWWDASDWLEKLFYELVIDTLADAGNCFGMSLEAIYARRGASLFSLPLDKYKTWGSVREEFNVKHQYQVGADPIFWFLGQLASGNTHDPVDVFQESRFEFARGAHPVLCISQDWDFGGSPHCILPVAWNDTTSPWEITICDPNDPGNLRTLTVNPEDNTYRYVRDSKTTYKGGEWSGGRLHYMPFTILNHQPRTPIWDAIQLILSGTVMLVGDDAQTEAITDLNGLDLDAYGKRATKELQGGRDLEGFFASFKGFDRRATLRKAAGRPGARTSAGKVASAARRVRKLRSKGTVAGELLVALGGPDTSVGKRRGAYSAIAAHATVDALAHERGMRSVAKELRSGETGRALAGRTIQHVLNDPETADMLSIDARKALEAVMAASGPGDFIHKLSGVRNGSFDYALKRGLTTVHLGSRLKSGEPLTIESRDFGTSKSAMVLSSSRERDVTITVDNKLGVGRDRVTMTLEGVPVTASGELQLNAKPGLGGVELVSTAGGGKPVVSIKARVNGKTINRQFEVPLDGGVRIMPASALGENVLMVSKIPALFAPSTNGKIIMG